MNQKRLIVLFLSFFLLLAPRVQSQVKLGVIVIVDDSLITHSHIGWTIFENYKNDYTLPFDLEDYCIKVVDTIYSNNNAGMEIVWLEKRVFQEYLHKKEILRGKDFKKYRVKWYADLVAGNNLDAMMVITTTDLNLVYGMNATRIETENICVSTGTNKKLSGLNIRLKSYIFWQPKPKRYKVGSFNVISEDFPMESKDVAFTNEQLLEFEEPLKKLLRDQLVYIKKSEDYNAMLIELRRQAALRKYNENKK